jgi:hypothetical protein
MTTHVSKLLLRVAKERRLSEANANVVPPARIKREQSASERDAVYRPQGYYTFFCIHAKHKFGPCSSCKRTQRDADKIRDKMLSASVRA